MIKHSEEFKQESDDLRRGLEVTEDARMGKYHINIAKQSSGKAIFL